MVLGVWLCRCQAYWPRPYESYERDEYQELVNLNLARIAPLLHRSSEAYILIGCAEARNEIHVEALWQRTIKHGNDVGRQIEALRRELACWSILANAIMARESHSVLFTIVRFIFPTKIRSLVHVCDSIESENLQSISRCRNMLLLSSLSMQAYC